MICPQGRRLKYSHERRTKGRETFVWQGASRRLPGVSGAAAVLSQAGSEKRRTLGVVYDV